MSEDSCSCLFSLAASAAGWSPGAGGCDSAGISMRIDSSAFGWSMKLVTSVG